MKANLRDTLQNNMMLDTSTNHLHLGTPNIVQTEDNLTLNFEINDNMTYV